MSPRILLITALILTLAGCGTQKNSIGLNVFNSLKARVINGKAKPPNARAQLTRQVIDSFPKPLIFVKLSKSGINSALEFQASNGTVRRFGAPDGTALAFDRGILVRSHGLGFDLMSADVSDLTAALRHGGSGNAVRIERRLRSDNKEITRSFVCTVSAQGRETIEIFQRLHSVTRMVEDCQNIDTRFQNIFWIGAGGTIWKSKVWMGDELGFVTTEVL